MSEGEGKRKDECVKREKIRRRRIAVGDVCKDAIVFFIPPSNYLCKTHSSVECLAVKIIQSESRHFFGDKICRRQCILVFLVFVVLGQKINFKICRPSDVGKSKKKPVQKESNCKDVCKVCQVNLKATYGKSMAKACGNIFKPSARKQIQSR